MTESMEHAAAVKLQERIDSIALAMAQVKEEQDQVKVALRGGDAYLGMTRQSHGQDLLENLRQLREEANQLGAEKVIILKAQRKLGEEKPAFLWTMASGQGGGQPAPASARTRTSLPSTPGPPPQAAGGDGRVDDRKVDGGDEDRGQDHGHGEDKGEEKPDIEQPWYYYSELETTREALDATTGDIRAGDSATSPAPTRAPSPSTQSPASTVGFDVAAGVKVEVITVHDDESDNPRSQDATGGDRNTAGAGTSSIRPHPPVTAAVTDTPCENASQNEEQGGPSDLEPTEEPPDFFIPIYDGPSIDKAVEEGDLPTLQAAFREDPGWISRRGKKVAQLAADWGQLTILRWAVAQGCGLTNKVSTAAAENGHVEMLQFLIDARCPFPKKKSAPCENAASDGYLEVLGLLRQMDCQWDASTCRAAAQNGHLRVLQWARSQDPPCPWNAQTCAMAAKFGHLEVLQWARRSGCPWDEATTINSAWMGHLDVFKWAIANDCPWDATTCKKWAKKHVLEWINFRP